MRAKLCTVTKLCTALLLGLVSTACAGDDDDGGRAGQGGAGNGAGNGAAGTSAGQAGAAGHAGSAGAAGNAGHAGSAHELDSGALDSDLPDDFVPPDPCSTASECVRPAEACVVPACVANVCVAQDVDSGTTLASEHQTPGDCLRLECDGMGRSRSVADNSDSPAAGPACNGQPVVETLGESATEVCATTNDMGVALWLNVFSVDETRELLSFEQHFEVLEPFEARFVVYESATIDGAYERIVDRHVQLTPGAPMFHGTGALDATTLQAGKFYGVGVGVGTSFAAGPLARTRCLTNQGRPAVSFGTQEGASTDWLLPTTAPVSLNVATVYAAGTVVPQRLSTR